MAGVIRVLIQLDLGKMAGVPSRLRFSLVLTGALRDDWQVQAQSRIDQEFHVIERHNVWSTVGHELQSFLITFQPATASLRALFSSVLI